MKTAEKNQTSAAVIVRTRKISATDDITDKITKVVVLTEKRKAEVRNMNVETGNTTTTARISTNNRQKSLKCKRKCGN